MGGGGTERLLLSPESHGGTTWFLRGQFILFPGGNRSVHRVVTKVERTQSVDERLTDPYISRFNPGRASLDIETGRVKLTDLA
jgi:hypothetical protein